MSELKEMHGEEGIQKIGELIQDIRMAMLTTVAEDGTICSRPMATQNEPFNGTVWFLTALETGKVREIQHNLHVSLIYADPGHAKYLTAKGFGYVSDDRAKIHELWNPLYEAWFPQGVNDPAIRVLRIEISEAEYWEASSSRIVRSIKYLARAIGNGNVEMGEHAKALV